MIFVLFADLVDSFFSVCVFVFLVVQVDATSLLPVAMYYLVFFFDFLGLQSAYLDFNLSVQH